MNNVKNYETIWNDIDKENEKLFVYFKTKKNQKIHKL